MDQALALQIKSAAGNLTSPDVKRLAKAHYEAAVALQGMIKTGPTAPQASQKSKEALQLNGFAVTVNNKKSAGVEIPPGIRELLGNRLSTILPVTADTPMTEAQVRRLRKELLTFARALQVAAK